MIKIEFIEPLTKWSKVLNAARTTIGKESVKNEPFSIHRIWSLILQGKIWKETKKLEPSSAWKKKILLAEHSPIRLLIIDWKWIDIKSWVSVHFVRHKIGIEHFVKTQRVDRTGNQRDQSPQDAKVNHECVGNAQAIINISRKRLCSSASKETRDTWLFFLEELKAIEPELHSVSVKECLYRGFCPELKCCGYVETEDFKIKLAEYRYH
jgi:hypothetical protein